LKLELHTSCILRENNFKIYTEMVDFILCDLSAMLYCYNTSWSTRCKYKQSSKWKFEFTGLNQIF